MVFRPTLRGSGLYAPTRVMSNDEVALLVDTSDEWIRERTGIRRRHIAGPSETTSDQAIEAGKSALADAGLTGRDIDLTIVATSTPDYAFPASACLVQHALGSQGGACDVEAACSGFVYALAMASGLIGIGTVRNALVIGSEVFSRVLDWHDRRTCVLFGDGAGAVVLSRSELSGPAPSFVLRSDGGGGDMLKMPATGSAAREDFRPPGIHMNGPETFKFGVRVLVEAAEATLENAGMTIDAIDWLVPHQANQRIISAATKRLGVNESRVMCNIEEFGNTSAASIPIAIADWKKQGKLQHGHRLLMVGFGAGLTWAGALLGWRD